MAQVLSSEAFPPPAPKCAESAADHLDLNRVADLIDLVCARRRELDPRSHVPETRLRCALFELLDAPNPQTWAALRTLELFPHFVPGLVAPSPQGVTVEDALDAYGVADSDVPSRAYGSARPANPSRETLIRAITWAAREYRTLAQG